METNKKPRLLFAEDDENLRSVSVEYLKIKGFDVDSASDGKEALNKYRSNKYDLLVLDVMMPEMDGFTLAEEIRKQDKETPLIFLTALEANEHKIRGFNSGADDYVTKPFQMEELKVRIEAILRRTFKAEEKTVFEFGEFKFDSIKQTLIHKSGKEEKLTTKESELLRLLALNMNKVLMRETALVKIWGKDDYYTARSMDVFITKLRKYLKLDENLQIINIHATGYKLVDTSA